MTRFASVCVFCGSSAGARPSYAEAAAALGAEVAARGLRLVYGGGRVGLMGTVADAALAAGGEVVGVIPQSLVDRELAHEGLTDLHVVGGMHERKALMAELADGFVALPGGLGTLEELAEVLTWSMLGLQTKPCGLLDVEGYQRPLLAYLDHAEQEGFLRAEHRALVLTDDRPAGVLDALAAWRPGAAAPRWSDRGPEGPTV